MPGRKNVKGFFVKGFADFFVVYFIFYATLPYIRHFISAGCYDNDPWYLGTNLRGI
jgi:hypothetical protein